VLPREKDEDMAFGVHRDPGDFAEIQIFSGIFSD